jgi:hypothetical protein
MREKHGPVVADPLMEVNRALRRVSGEIGSYVVDPKRHLLYLPFSFLKASA